MTTVERVSADEGRARTAPSTLWQVNAADGQVVYRGPDLELANDIYGGSPGGHLFSAGARSRPVEEA